ncbi:DUF2924 domain-containing protein [Lysobacter enzymogenes]|uniref:restriction system modified-DNA reader domain-containing protein n=1 Tax=Lysobacter enzymogenes TaxID=69 RepID=UPI001A96D896|nr:DUF2924 domain-containing protein [Lysobacter enzymogenes]QQP95029.1 DUF2924 domain-containing protein [Lysobacter enzymogenes]
MARKSSPALVSEYLERLSGEMFEPAYRTELSDLIRGKAGIYALYKGERLYYVGLARNLEKRVGDHLKDQHAGKWDSFSVYLISASEHIKSLESLLLRVLFPKGNQVSGKLVGAVDKKNLLLKAMKETDSARRARLVGAHRPAPTVRKKAATGRGAVALAGVVKRALPLLREYGGEVHRASLRSDGYIHYKGQKYRSPSAAAGQICPGAVNGWYFWYYEASKGDWVPLDRLRK